MTVRLEPILDVVVIGDVDERDEVGMDSEGVDAEDDKVEEFTDLVVSDEIVDTEDDKVEEITGIVTIEVVEEVTGIVTAEDDGVAEDSILLVDVEDDGMSGS